MLRYKKTLDAVPLKIVKDRNAKVLDIGGYSVFEEMFKNRYQLAEVQTFQTDDLNRDQLPFRDNSFDLIILGEVIEHLYDPDQVLRECYRILRSGGALLITTPNLLSWYNRILMVFGYYPMNLDISCEVRKTGLRDILNKRPLFDVNLNPLYDVHIRLYTFKTLEILLAEHRFSNFERYSYSVDRSAHFKIRLFIRLINCICEKIKFLAQGIIIIGWKI